MIYNCEKCKYTTKNKTDFTRHEQSTKHKINIRKTYICKCCNTDFVARSTFYSHRKKCQNFDKNQENIAKSKSCAANTENINDSDLKIKLILTEKNLEIEKMKTEYEKEKVKILEDVIKNSNKTADKALNITSKTISALKYANNNFKDAPPLSPLSNFNIMGYDLEDEEDKKKLIEDLLFYYRKNSVHTIFGKHIIAEYKKDNIKEQSMHTTDTARLNYIIKTGPDNIKNNIKNNVTTWAQDKNGIFVCNNLIDKLINHHVEILKWYNQLLTEEMALDPGRPQHHLQKKVESISKLLGDIESGQIIKETNKFIAPFFNLDK